MIARVGKTLEQKLSETRRWWRTTRLLSGTAWLVCVTVALALICYHSDRITGGLSATARETWRFAIGIAALITLLTALIRPLMRRLPDKEIAADVERRYPVLRERLLTTIDLLPAYGTAGASAGTASGFSRILASSLAEETRLASADLDFRRAVNVRPLRTALACAVLPVLVLGVDYGMAPDAFANWLRRMAAPHADVAPWAQTRVWVKPGLEVLPRGDGLSVTVTTQGTPTQNCTLFYRPAGDAAAPWKSVTLEKPTRVKTASVGEAEEKEHRTENTSAPNSRPSTTETASEQVFRYRFPALGQNVALYATANDGKSNERTVRVEDRPALLNMKLKLKFPAYIHRPDQTLAETTGNIAAPTGTEVEIVGTANKPLKSAVFSGDGGASGAWRVNEEKVQGRLAVWKDGGYRLDLTDHNGFDNPATPRYEIRAIPDQTPTVQLLQPGTDIELVPGGSLPLAANAADDYGIASMHLVYARARGEAYRGTSADTQETRGALAFEGEFGKTPVKVNKRWRIGDQSVRPGDVLRYAVTATDGDNLRGPHTGRSAEFRVRIVSLLEMQNKLKAAQQEEARALEQLRKQQIEAQRAQQQARIKPTREAIARAQEMQRAQAQEAKSLAQRIAQTSTQLENNNLATPSELKRRQNAADTLQNLAQQKMPQAADTIQKAQPSPKPSLANQPQNASSPTQAQAKQELAKADQQQNDIRQDIEKAQQQLSRTPAAEQLAQKASQLAQEQQRLADSSRFLAEEMRGQKQAGTPMTPEMKSGMEMQKRQQKEVNAETQKLQQQMQQAAKESAERGQQQQADALQKAAQQMKQGNVAGNQEKAQQQLQKNSPGEAASPQDKAASALQKAADAAQKAAQQSNPDSNQAAAEKLEKAAQQLRDMAQKQREIAQKTAQSPNAQQSQQLGQQEQQMQKQAQETQKSLQNSPSAQKSLQNAQQNLSKSGQQLQQNSPQSAQSPAQQAAKQLEQAAREAQQSAQQLRQQQAAQEMAEKVERLARTQRAIQSATQRLNQEKQKGALDANQMREMGQVAERQEQAEQQARDLAEQFPSPAFQKALSMASKQMQPATKNLNRKMPDTGSETQDAQNKAAQTLETITKALQQQASGGQQNQQQNGQQNQQQMSPQQAQQQAALGDLTLAQGLQQQLRQETGALDQARARNQNQQLTPQQQQQAQQLAQGQKTTEDIAQGAAKQLDNLPGVGDAIRQATQEMQQAGQKLQQQQTGKPTQGNQDNASRQLEQAAKQAQQQMQQQQQQQQAQANAQQGAPQPNPRGKPQKSPMRLEDVKKGVVSAPDGRAGRFGGLDPRSQRTLREGQQERVPAEYQDIVSRYYRSLSEKKR